MTLLLDLGSWRSGAKLGRASFFLILQLRNKVINSAIQYICLLQLIFENHVSSLRQCEVKLISLNYCINCRVYCINYCVLPVLSISQLL